MPELPIYLDYNATTPCDSRVAEAMVPFFTRYFGNAASRSHSFGWQAEEAVEIAREQVAALVGASPKEIVFTSGATEATNLAIKGVAEAYAPRGRHIITTATEHKAVLDTCAHLEQLGYDVTVVPVDSDGLPNVVELESAIRSDTILIAVMYANNETGVINPIKEIGMLAKKHGVLFFTDATQAAGKIPVHVLEDNVDLLALSAHKMYGPKGVGALYVRRRDPRVRLTAQIDGGGHERGMRSGTLNVAGIVGFGKACSVAATEMGDEATRLLQLRNQLEAALLSLPDTSVNGHRDQRLPHVLNISFGDRDGQALLGKLNRTMAVSSGSACMSASMEPSYVLRAMGVEDNRAYASIRFSLGKNTTGDEIEFVIDEVGKIIREEEKARI